MKTKKKNKFFKTIFLFLFLLIPLFSNGQEDMSSRDSFYFFLISEAWEVDSCGALAFRSNIADYIDKNPELILGKSKQAVEKLLGKPKKYSTQTIYRYITDGIWDEKTHNCIIPGDTYGRRALHIYFDSSGVVDGLNHVYH